MAKRKLPDDSIVIDLYNNGKSSAEIASLFNLSNGSPVIKLLKRCGITARCASDAQKQSYLSGRKIIKYWDGKKQPPEMVKKRIDGITGEKHYLYKNGKSTRHYRDGIKKEFCDKCKSKNNLGIHHKDFDHYNDDPFNLQILCVSCHSSVHKTEYWRCKKLGLEYKNNSPIGWNK